MFLCPKSVDSMQFLKVSINLWWSAHAIFLTSLHLGIHSQRHIKNSQNLLKGSMFSKEGGPPLCSFRAIDFLSFQNLIECTLMYIFPVIFSNTSLECLANFHFPLLSLGATPLAMWALLHQDTMAQLTSVESGPFGGVQRDRT